MNIFISGGCKNGKSYHAQQAARSLAAKENLPLYYLATMIPHDGEDRARIARHLAERRDWGFETIEQGTDICACLAGRTLSGSEVRPEGIFLLDSVTALLSNEMFREDGSVDKDAPRRVAAELAEFCRRVGNAVIVSDYIYSDAMRYGELTEEYRRGLALTDRTLAALCDSVIEVAYGFTYQYK